MSASSQHGLLNSNSANVLSALGTLIGYLGTEVATGDLFERQLWPQRFYNGFTIYNAWKLALLMPMGGPLHKAALQTLDKFFKNGLFKGGSLGRMLGTAFFFDSKIRYTVYEEGIPPQQEHVRNGLWIRAIEDMPILAPQLPKKIHQEDGVPLIKKVRQKTTVSHLILSRASSKRNGKEVSRDTGSVGFRTYTALILTETTGIATAIAVMVIWRSWFMLLWVAPLALKLLSAAFTMQREDLTAPPPLKKEDRVDVQVCRPKKFEIANNGNGFLVVEGDDSTVLQFFRHYGHPIRSRAREILQMAIVVGFGSIFPVGLVCSLVWMSPALQYVWLSYQLYATIAMHAYRYARGHQCATTEEMIWQEFAQTEASHQESTIIFGDRKETRVCATLIRTPHDSFAEGKAHVLQLLAISEKYASVDHDAMHPPPRRTASEASTESAMSVNSNGKNALVLPSDDTDECMKPEN